MQSGLRDCQWTFQMRHQLLYSPNKRWEFRFSSPGRSRSLLAPETEAPTRPRLLKPSRNKIQSSDQVPFCALLTRRKLYLNSDWAYRKMEFKRRAPALRIPHRYPPKSKLRRIPLLEVILSLSFVSQPLSFAHIYSLARGSS